MAIRSILVHVDAGPACARRVEFAVALAAEHGAHLIGLHVRDNASLPFYIEPSLEFIEKQKSWAAREAADAKAIFDAAVAQGAQAPTEWRAVDGGVLRTVAAAARCADLTIVGQHDPDAPGYFTPATLAEDLVFAAGGPVLVVPYIGAAPKLRRVLVGWNGSREAARAVHDALPLLLRAERVTVLSIAAAGADPQAVPGADLCQALARHDVPAEAATTVAAGIEPGELLLSEAASGSADLIVMGAYGRSRAREMLLGGATRSVLRQMTVPVLFAH